MHFELISILLASQPNTPFNQHHTEIAPQINTCTQAPCISLLPAKSLTHVPASPSHPSTYQLRSDHGHCIHQNLTCLMRSCQDLGWQWHCFQDHVTGIRIDNAGTLVNHQTHISRDRLFTVRRFVFKISQYKQWYFLRINSLWKQHRNIGLWWNVETVSVKD